METTNCKPDNTEQFRKPDQPTKQDWPMLLLPDFMLEVFMQSASNIATIAAALQVIAENLDQGERFTKMQKAWSDHNQRLQFLESETEILIERLITLEDISRREGLGIRG